MLTLKWRVDHRGIPPRQNLKEDIQNQFLPPGKLPEFLEQSIRSLQNQPTIFETIAAFVWTILYANEMNGGSKYMELLCDSFCWVKL